MMPHMSFNWTHYGQGALPYRAGYLSVIPHEMSSPSASARFHAASGALGKMEAPSHEGTCSLPSPSNRRRAPMSCRRISETSFFSVSSPTHSGRPQVTCVGRSSTPTPFHRSTYSRLAIWSAVLACERSPAALSTSHIPSCACCEWCPMMDNRSAQPRQPTAATGLQR